MDALPYLDAETLRSTVPWPDAIDALESALATLDLAAARARIAVPTARGELLLMPSESRDAVGVKLLSVAPRNHELGRPRIQAVYVLFDAMTLTPNALIDGAALTALRTSALSALAVRQLAPASATSLTVFGSGPQAEAHVHALLCVRPICTITIVGRDPGRAETLAARLRSDGLDVTTGSPDSVREADIVVCATTARAPLFDAALLTDRACVVAVGSHQPDARELDGQVFARAVRVVVEDRATALREAGDIVLAIADRSLTVDDLVELATLTALPAASPALTAPPSVEGITVFKSVGMGWQDLAVAQAAVRGVAGTHIALPDRLAVRDNRS